MDNDVTRNKLENQESPTMLFSDIDGTLFSPNFTILTAPFYNAQTASYLKEKSIPFVTVTGRSFWRSIDKYHLSLLGMPKADIVITANGTAIYYRRNENYVSDFAWQGMMQSTKITDQSGQTFSWNKWEISNVITKYLTKNNYPHIVGKGNTYLIRLRIDKYPVEKVQKIRKDILELFPKGIRVILTEKLLWKNTLDIFSGEILITPSTAGKDKAVAYILKNLSTEINKPIHAFVFGDATVDIPMLTMKEDTHYTLSQYGIHPTPLTEMILQEKMKTNTNIHILYGDGPKEILWTLRPDLRKIEEKKSVEKIVESKLSPAQNNKARRVVKLFETFLDRLVDKNLSPNEISFLGLQKLSHGLSLLNKPQGSFLEKTKGLYHYGFGNLTDVLDGIRARNSDKKEENGQLVDGFSDRAKEFMQLFQRAKKRTKEDESTALQTFLTSISCALPSIARAQVEIGGKTVSERDEKGGSMIDRTKRLFLSLFFDSFNMPDQSFEKDMEIYTTNIATYKNRLTSAKKFDSKIKMESLSDFQKKALERFLLYVDVLQQEDAIIKKYLSKYQTLLKQYEKESSKLIKNYSELPINKLRKKFGIKDYKLEIKNYL